MREPVTFADARLLFHEYGVDISVDFLRLNELHLMLDGFAGILILSGAMSRDEECYVLRFRHAWERKLFNHLASTGHNNVGHALVGADRAAIVERLSAALLDAREARLSNLAETEFARNYLFRKVSFANKERHDEHARRKGAAQHSGQCGFLFPKSLQDLGEQTATA